MGGRTPPGPKDNTSSSFAAAIAAAAKIPYWQVNVASAVREQSCPIFLQDLSAKDREIISTPDEAYTIHTWAEVKDIVAKNQLNLFQRVPSDLRRYLKFVHHLRQEHGSVVEYMLRERLGWQLEEEKEEKEGGRRPFERVEDVKVLRNDWPYGIDGRIVHLVVWTKFDLEDDDETGDLTGQARRCVEEWLKEKFVGRVSRDKMIWFKNWKSLKSVKAVEHFHIMLFDPDPDFIHEVTNGDTPMCDNFV